jgi:hypothetical protein
MSKKARGLTKSLHSPEYAALRELLVAARQKARLTQQEVARQLKAPSVFRGRIRRWRTQTRCDRIIAVSKVLQSDPVKLLRALLALQ